MSKSNQELTDALSAPVGEFIAAVAKGVADAQQAMDMNTIETFRSVYSGTDVELDELRQLGYQPTWYKIPELTAEIHMALSINATALETAQESNLGRANKFALLAAPVDANYVNAYNYNINGASKVKFTIVPVPPSAQAEAMKVMPFFDDKKTLNEVIRILNLLDIPYATFTQADEYAPLIPITEEAIKSANPIVFDLPIKNVRPSAGIILSPGQVVKVVVADMTPADPSS